MLIRKGSEIVWMHSVHYESDKRAALIWPEHAHSRQLHEPFGSINGKLRIVLENGGPSNLLEVVNCRSQAYRPCNIRRAGLKSVRGFLEGAFVQSTTDAHFAPAFPRRDGVENLSPTTRCANDAAPAH